MTGAMAQGQTTAGMGDGVRRTGWRAFFGSLFAYASRRLLAAGGLVLLAGLLENVGLFVILPLVALVIVGQGAGGQFAWVEPLVAGWAPGGAPLQLALLSAAILALLVLRAAVLTRRDMLVFDLSKGYVDHLRTAVMDAVVHASWPAIRQLEQARLIDAVTVNVARVGQVVQFFVQAGTAIILSALFLGAALAADWRLGTLLALFVALAATFAALRLKRSYRTGSAVTAASGHVMRETGRIMGGLKLARAYNAERAFTARFAASVADTRRLAREFQYQQMHMRRLFEIAGAALALGLLYFGFAVLAVPAAQLLVFAGIVLRLVPVLVPLFGALQNLAFALTAYEAVEQLRHEALAHALPPEADGPQARAALPSAIALDHARVAVGEHCLLETGKLVLGPTGLVVLRGPSGAGKSTLVELLAGLYLPAAGALRRGDAVLAHDGLRAWQRDIALAPQEPFLFNATLRENLCWPGANHGDGELWAALEAAQVAELVRQLPHGLDEPLHDQGARLSGGERQRLCLARTLLKPARILLLDEAMSALDPAREAAVLAMLRASAKDRLVVLASHSPLAEDYADRIIRVEAGRVLANS
ncbi:MAG: ABC transporter ATP-binding protein [Sphingomonadales bacterium]|nr:ABC transporter ATP-binding protein [Sphingomonadales bacterium]MBD3772883.1 ABC transporter ATP-binding protein [Paracoccaceae bacterium]